DFARERALNRRRRTCDGDWGGRGGRGLRHAAFRRARVACGTTRSGLLRRAGARRHAHSATGRSAAPAPTVTASVSPAIADRPQYVLERDSAIQQREPDQQCFDEQLLLTTALEADLHLADDV